MARSRFENLEVYQLSEKIAFLALGICP
ncbi:hypothetical protein E3A20_19860, partial [Planctomyces bekefii]